MKKPITIISSISIILFLTAIVWFAAGIYTDKKAGTQKADSRYEKLLNDTRENFSKNAYGSPEFSKSFILAIGNIDDFSSLKLEVNGSLVYSYPPEFFSIPSPELVKSYNENINIGENTFTLKASIYLMKPLSIYNHSKIAFLLILIGTIAVGFYLVLSNASISSPSPSSISQNRKSKPVYRPISENKTSTNPSAEKQELPAKEKSETRTLTFEESSPKEETTISFEEVRSFEELSQNNNTSKKPESEEEQSISFNENPVKETKSNTFETFSPSEEISISFDEPSVQEEKSVSFDKPFVQDEKSISFDESSVQESKSISFDENSSNKHEPVFNPEIAENFENESLSNETEDEDGGLDIIDQFEQANQELSDEDFFSYNSNDSKPEQKSVNNNDSSDISPVTSLFIQASLNQKLDEVINLEKQAILVLIKINGLDRGNFISQEVIDILRTVQSNVQIFEYKADSYAIIMRGIDLQAAVDIFEEVYNKIADFLKDNNAVNEVSIGISAVSGRNVDAERVTLEANQALEYASQDPDSPIVAFRANPEKYRKFQESQNA